MFQVLGHGHLRLWPTPSNQAKFHISNIGHDGTLLFRNFLDDVEKFQEFQFRVSMLHWTTAIIRPKSNFFNIGHDGR
jgi:hypothetical protein